MGNTEKTTEKETVWITIYLKNTEYLVIPVCQSASFLCLISPVQTEYFWNSELVGQNNTSTQAV